MKNSDKYSCGLFMRCLLRLRWRCFNWNFRMHTACFFADDEIELDYFITRHRAARNWDWVVSIERRRRVHTIFPFQRLINPFAIRSAVRRSIWGPLWFRFYCLMNIYGGAERTYFPVSFFFLCAGLRSESGGAVRLDPAERFFQSCPTVHCSQSKYS